MTRIPKSRQPPALVWFLSAVFASCASTRALAAQSVKLAWNSSTAPDVINYNLYYGCNSGSYTNKTALNNVTNATVTGLAENTTYYFAVTASDLAGEESPASNEVMYTVPAPAALQILITGSPATLNISATGNVPAQWTLQCSTNLQTWDTCASGANMPVSFQMPVASAPQMFFRLAGQN